MHSCSKHFINIEFVILVYLYTKYYIYIPNPNRGNSTLAIPKTYTVHERPLHAQEGIGYAADFPVDIRILGLAVSEDFVHVEVGEVVGNAASV